MLAVLTLTHEDALNSLACPDQCILLTRGPQGITQLMGAAQDWPTPGLDEELDGRTDEEVREFLFQALGRVSSPVKILMEDNSIPYLQWCHRQKCLI